MDNENNSTTQNSQFVQSMTESNQESQTMPYADNHEVPKYSKKILSIILIIILLLIVCYFCLKSSGTNTSFDNSSVVENNSSFIAEKYDRIINSSSSREEAKQAVKEEFNDAIEKNEIIEETEDYYGLDVSWGSYNEKVISFKKSTYDYKSIFSNSTGWTTLVNKIVTKDKNKIKTILDVIYKIKNKNNGSFEWISSQLNENAKEYTYELKYKKTVSGDWGMDDEVSTEIITQSIEKNTGEISEPRTTKE